MSPFALLLSFSLHATPPPHTHGGRLAAMCEDQIIGFGTEKKLRRKFAAILPRHRLRVERIEAKSLGQDHLARVDGLEFTVEPRGVFGLFASYKLRLYEQHRVRLDHEIHNPNRLALNFDPPVATIYSWGAKSGPEQITLRYGPDGQLTEVVLGPILGQVLDLPRSVFRVLEIPEWRP